MTEGLQKKVDRAIRLLQSIPQDGDIEVSYSGGKILMSFLNLRRWQEYLIGQYTRTLQ